MQMSLKRCKQYVFPIFLLLVFISLLPCPIASSSVVRRRQRALLLLSCVFLIRPPNVRSFQSVLTCWDSLLSKRSRFVVFAFFRSLSTCFHLQPMYPLSSYVICTKTHSCTHAISGLVSLLRTELYSNEVLRMKEVPTMRRGLLL